jgi:hypothetical protein
MVNVRAAVPMPSRYGQSHEDFTSPSRRWSSGNSSRGMIDQAKDKIISAYLNSGAT